MKYTAIVGFRVMPFDAENVEQVEVILNKLIDQLTTVETDVVWDDVDWIIQEDTEQD